MRTVSTAEVATAEDAREELPERVQEALGELAGAAKEGLMALCRWASGSASSTS